MFIALQKFQTTRFVNVNDIKIIRKADPDVHNPDYDPKVHPGSVVFTTSDETSVSQRYYSTMSPEDLRDVINDAAAQVHAAPIADRLIGLDNTLARLCRSVEDWLELATTPIINCDGMTPEDAERFKAAMRETQATLNSIQPRLQPGPVTEKMLESDVAAVCQLLEDREWAEHCTTTKLGQRLESAVTDLVGQASNGLRGEALAQEDRAEKAETELGDVRDLLRQTMAHLEWVSDTYRRDGTLGVFNFSDMEKIADFVRKNKNNACEKE